MHIRINLILLACLYFSYTLLSQEKGDLTMATKATAEELQLFKNNHPEKGYFVFPESRTYPIRMHHAIPKHWCYKSEYELTHYSGEVHPGEFYTFQLGIYPHSINVEGVSLLYSDLKNSEGRMIPKRAFRCFNLGGVDKNGMAFSKTVNVPAGKIQPLWIGIQIPEDASGYYKGDLVVSGNIIIPTTVQLNIGVKGSYIPKSGENEGWRMARLKWLDSDIAIDDSITKPYLPLVKDGLTINLLGRSVDLQRDGLPGQIRSYFTGSVTKIGTNARNILVSPFRFVVERKEGLCEWENGSLEFKHVSEGILEWESDSKSVGLDLNCKGKMEYDGFLEYSLTLKALEDLDINDVRLEIPVKGDVAKYLMGLDNKGGLRPREFEWRWSIKKNQDAVWIGDVNAGLQCKFKDANYKSPLVNIYYQFSPLNMPVSWENHGKGGIRIVEETPGVILLEAFSGSRLMKKGEELYFDFELMLTPVKTINVSDHFTTRYIHKGNVEEMLEDAAKYRANVINVHHSKSLNPFINYPYLDETVPDFKEYIHAAHEENIKVKPYYTTREITVNLPEFWALWSLQGEIIFPGPGKDVRTVLHKNGPDPWLVENLEENFIPAWVHKLSEGKFAGKTDLSVITTPDTRWNNFYLEGINWMVQNLDIDGLYIDDTALDRESFKRARKIFDRNKPDCLIDLHSWNVFDYRAGWNNNANQYMKLFPYIDRIWFGENFHYEDNPADYWLIEVSGIPFGLMGEMLQDGGNPWKGMVFGMTNRIYQDANPVPIWNFIDKYDLMKSEMTGYWDANSPVKTNNRNILATSYRNDEFTVVSVANFSHKDQECLLDFNWGLLNMDENSVAMCMPYIEGFQEKGQYDLGNFLKIEGDKGFLLVIQKKL